MQERAHVFDLGMAAASKLAFSADLFACTQIGSKKPVRFGNRKTSIAGSRFPSVARGPRSACKMAFA